MFLLCENTQLNQLLIGGITNIFFKKQEKGAQHERLFYIVKLYKSAYSLMIAFFIFYNQKVLPCFRKYGMVRAEYNF